MKNFILFIILSLSLFSNSQIVKNGTTYEVSGTFTTSSTFYTALASAGATVETISGQAHSVFYNVNFGDDSISFLNGSNIEIPFIRSIWTFSGNDKTNRISCLSGSKLHLTSPQNINSFQYKTLGGEIRFAIVGGVNWDNRTLDTRNGCNVLFEGITFKGEHSPWIEGNTTFKNCIVEKEGNDGDIQFNISNGNSTVLDNVTMYASGQSGITFRDGVPTIKNVRIFGARDSFNNESSANIVIEGLDSDTGAVADISQWSSRYHQIKNAKNGCRFVWANHLNGNNPQNYNNGSVEVTQVVSGSATIAGQSSIPTSYKISFPAKINTAGAGINSIFDGQNLGTARNYVLNSNIDGTFPTTELLTGWGRSGMNGFSANGNIYSLNDAGIIVNASISSPIINTNNKAQDQAINNRTWYAVGYKYFFQSGKVYLGGSNVEVKPIFAIDTQITEQNEATVLAYTQVENSAKFYDIAKKYIFDNFVNQSSTLVTRSGNIINAGTYNVVINPNATSTFAFNGTTITLKASTFTGNIVTTGTLTLLNGAKIYGGYQDSTGRWKFIDIAWTDTSTHNVSIINKNNNSVLLGPVSSTQFFKTHLLLPNPEPSNGLEIRITSSANGTTLYSRDSKFGEFDFIDLQIILNDVATSANQKELIDLAERILLKTQVTNDALKATSTPTITVNENITTSTINGTVTNQIAIKELLVRILNKVTANREAFKNN